MISPGVLKPDSPPSHRPRSLSWFLLRLCFAILAFAALWLPEFRHYHVDRAPPGAAAIEAARSTPGAEVLAEIAAMPLTVSLGIKTEDLVSASEAVLQGKLHAPAYLDGPRPIMGYPGDIETGPPTLRLALAGLALEDQLVRAFEASGDERFLREALRRTVAFATYERSRRIDSGFLWNDHAIAARVAAMARLWRHLRERPDLAGENAAVPLTVVQQAARMLLKPDHFTVRTNHGVMQNLALLQIAAGFPSLDPEHRFVALALERLGVQAGFFVSPEGIVLEHSAGYHAHGSELLAVALRLCELNRVQPPPFLADAARRSHEVLALLRRPDGTLPAFGNTEFGAPSAPPGPDPAPGNHLFPVAGYALWWTAAGESARDRPTQTVVAWAKHDGHGHKHADEGSLVLWSDGIDWITPTGYWPYGHPLTRISYSWTSSNALHEAGEGPKSPRQTSLRGVISAQSVRALDIERTNADGAVFRRQIVQIGGDRVLVIDDARELRSGAETLWTFSPDTDLITHPGTDTLLVQRGDARMQMVVLPIAAVLTRHRGSEAPFAGWVVRGGRPAPAPALQVLRPESNSLTATIFHLLGPAEASPPPVLSTDATAEHWRLEWSGSGDSLSLERQGDTLRLRDGSGSREYRWHPAPDVAQAGASLKAAYVAAVTAYPPWRDLTAYRIQASYGVGAFWLLVEVLVLVVVRRQTRITRGIPFHALLALLWSASVAFLLAFHLN